VQQVLLITKIDGTNPGKPGPNLEDLRLVFLSKGIKAVLILRPGPYDAHLPFQHIDTLRQFIDLRPPQDLSKGQNAGIMFESNGADMGLSFSMVANLIALNFVPILTSAFRISLSVNFTQNCLPR